MVKDGGGVGEDGIYRRKGKRKGRERIHQRGESRWQVDRTLMDNLNSQPANMLD